METIRAIVVVDSLDRAIYEALSYAISVAPHDVMALHVETNQAQTQQLLADWIDRGPAIRLTCVREKIYATQTALRAIEPTLDSRNPVIVVIPRTVPRNRWLRPLHRSRWAGLQSSLRDREGVMVVTVPFPLSH